MKTIEKIEKGIITLAEFTKDQRSFIRGIVKLSFNEGQEQLRIGGVSVSAYCELCGITTATETEDKVCLPCGSYGYCSMSGCKTKVQKLLICDGCGKMV